MSDTENGASWVDIKSESPRLVEQPDDIPLIDPVLARLESLHSRTALTPPAPQISGLTLDDFRKSVTSRLPAPSPGNLGIFLAAMEDVSADYPEIGDIAKIPIFKDSLSAEIRSHLVFEDAHRKSLDLFFQALRRVFARLVSVGEIQNISSKIKKDTRTNFAHRAIQIFNLARAVPGTSDVDAIRQCYEVQGRGKKFQKNLLTWVQEHQGRLNFADFLNKAHSLERNSPTAAACKFAESCRKANCSFRHPK